MKRLIIVFWMFAFFSFLYFPKTSFMKEKGRVLHIFTWPDFFDNAKIAEFEKETGIKVKLSYFTSNEELLIKLKTTNSKDYDLITPSDYAVKILIDQGVLAPIDHSRINILKELYPFVINQSFDPNNRYSIPFIWEAYGLGYHKKLFQNTDFSDFSPIFNNPGKNCKITMIPDPFEAIFLASLYLYGSIDTLTPAQLHEVKDLLKKQKSWVEAYVDDRSKYLISTNNCQLALFKSSYFMQIAHNPELAFAIPEKNTFITIESFAIPKNTENLDPIYEFLNYCYNPQNVAPHIQRVPLFPADPRALAYVDQPTLYFEILNQLKDRKENLYYFKYLLPEEEIRNAWVEVKAN